jgi:crotonobetainyl-CoA:carnitine CoA-transferase CaiB-like acyl-CoA transferase
MTYEDVTKDVQATGNGYIIDMELPGLGNTRLAGVPAMLSETPAKAQGIPPTVGQHTEEMLLELGYSWEDIAKLIEEEVI